MKEIIVSRDKDKDTIKIKIIDEKYIETDIELNDIYEYKLMVERIKNTYKDYKYRVLEEDLLLETVRTDVEEL